MSPQTATATNNTIYQRLTLHRYRHKANPRHHKHQQGLVVSSKYPSVRPCVCHKFTRVLTLIGIFTWCLCRPLVFEFSVGIGVSVIGLSQISFFFSGCYFQCTKCWQIVTFVVRISMRIYKVNFTNTTQVTLLRAAQDLNVLII